MDKQTLSETAAVVAFTARFAFINKSLVMTSNIVPLEVSVNETNLVVVSILNYQALPVHILAIVCLLIMPIFWQFWSCSGSFSL